MIANIFASAAVAFEVVALVLTAKKKSYVVIILWASVTCWATAFGLHGHY